MMTVLELPLCMCKLKRPVICVDDRLLPHNVMFPLSESLHSEIHLIVDGVFPNHIEKCLNVIDHYTPLLGENNTNSIVGGICFNFKWLFQVWQCEYWRKAKTVF